MLYVILYRTAFNPCILYNNPLPWLWLRDIAAISSEFAHFSRTAVSWSWTSYNMMYMYNFRFIQFTHIKCIYNKQFSMQLSLVYMRQSCCSIQRVMSECIIRKSTTKSKSMYSGKKRRKNELINCQRSSS